MCDITDDDDGDDDDDDGDGDDDCVLYRYVLRPRRWLQPAMPR